MHSHLLKKALPFTLTLILGAGLAGMFKPHRPKTLMWTWPEHSTPLLGREGPFDGLHEHRHSCDMRRRYLVAESKPLVILFKPDAIYPRVAGGYRDSVWVNVTFGADGKVQKVEQLQTLLPDSMLKAVERAARQIQFTPETVNSVPVSVTKDIEIHFIGD
jgi:hypothetical protein